MIAAWLVAALLTGVPHATLDWEQEGAARFARGDVAGALDAWNHVGEPIVDSLSIVGAARTDPAVVVEAIGIDQRSMLTSVAWKRALHRLYELPSIGVTLVCKSAQSGHVVVEATVDEDSALPLDASSLTAVVGKLIVLRDLQLPVNNLFHRGDDLTIAYRFPSAWRRARVEYSSPLRGSGAIADIQASLERQTYATSFAPGTPSRTAEDHLQQQVTFAVWTTRLIRWQGGASFDRWNTRRHLGALGTVDTRLAGDHVSVGADVSAWAPAVNDTGFARVNVWAAWRSSIDPTLANLSVVTQFAHATTHSPFDLWSGAGSGLGRPSLLRAHSVIVDDVIGGPTFGRRLTHATIEYQCPIATIASTPIGIGVFTDTARASHRIDGTASPWLIDAGAGLRWTAPGIGSVIRLDVAWPLQGGGPVVSAGWQAAWPR